MALILLIEDEKLLRWALGKQLERAGHTVHAAGDLAEASSHLERHQPDVMLLDLGLPDGHGLDFYESNLTELEETTVVVMTAVTEVEEAVRAMKLGAIDFLSKPVDQEALVELVERSLALRGQRREAQVARRERKSLLEQTMIAESPAFKEVVRITGEVARSQVDSILIHGETGVGKNVIARHLHAVSDRRDQPLLELSCAAVPDQLIESELLGHERGAFTDAKESRKGLFELADGGSLVLDEVGELKPDLQAKLLHVLEERRLRRVGGAREIMVDVRVLGLTNRDLAAMVRDGSFRQDLFFRLNVFPLRIPPLRERVEDILPLARHFLALAARKFGRPGCGFSREAENRMLAYAWPGNVRELRNVIERAMILDPSDEIGPTALILEAVEGPDAPRRTDGEDDGGLIPLDEMERRMIERAMRTAAGNQTRAAELLGITRDQLRYRLRKMEGEE